MTLQKEEKLRLDKYLWAIRIYKTRSLASRSINAGEVTLNKEKVKPSHFVKIGEYYEINASYKYWKIVVKELLHVRVGAAIAVNYYEDKSDPLENKKSDKNSSFFFNTGKRKSKIGRPTKRVRREMDDFFNEGVD